MNIKAISAKELALIKKIRELSKMNIQTFSCIGAFAPVFWLFSMTSAMEHAFSMMMFMFIVGVGMGILQLILVVRRDSWIKSLTLHSEGSEDDKS